MSETAQAKATHMSPQQSELPSGWRWVRLEEVCKQDRQIVESFSDKAGALTYFSLEHIEAETGRILRAPTEQVNDEGKSTTFCFDERHVLYGKLRPYLNKVALPNAPGRCTTEMIPLIPLEDTDREFLAWLLRRRETVDFAMQGKTGSRMPRADMDSLLKLSIPFPPLSEQRRIAVLLREQMASVETARTAAHARLEAIKALPAAFLRQVFPQPGQPLPTDWCLVRLGDVCEVVTGGTPSRAEARFYGWTLPWVKPEDLDRDMFVSASAEYLSIDGALVARPLPKGSVLVSCIGKIGKVAIAGCKLSTNQQINALVPGTGVDSVFLYFACQRMRSEWEAAASVALVPIINKGDFSSKCIPLPPFEEQQRIAAELREQMASVEKIRAAVDEELATINALPAALLRRAFSGEL